MKMLVSTKEMQGQRKSDFCFVPDGELVTFPYAECTREAVDGRCGCRRSLCGLEAHKATTTVMVAEFDFTKEKVVQKFVENLLSGGWFKLKSSDCLSLAEDCASEIMRIAGGYEVGTVLERRGQRIKVRKG